MTNQLRALRNKRKITQMELAEKSGVSRSAIARFETGRTQLTVGNLYEICKVLKCEMADVFREGK